MPVGAVGKGARSVMRSRKRSLSPARSTPPRYPAAPVIKTVLMAPDDDLALDSIKMGEATPVRLPVLRGMGTKYPEKASLRDRSRAVRFAGLSIAGINPNCRIFGPDQGRSGEQRDGPSMQIFDNGHFVEAS